MANNGDSTVVTYGSLDLAATDIKKRADELKRGLDEIKAKIASINDLWKGEAREAYNTTQERWNRDAEGVHQALMQISQAVAQAAPAYQGGDKRAASNF
ncbi:WXG100 family type VII secretion target [Streptomyces sp. GC420]|uniref:WXG100 family type VII secretion target n=1 Tax=Streptomyces sp. GC420 TaxID=2697568 RepID=UPI0014152CD7|nr:WXG100 family type VII secretion target [Streptomyces sp. GC420]NBM20494.1 WXG100 family type VII secretion target [Streptomyces sp. GC420]